MWGLKQSPLCLWRKIRDLLIRLGFIRADGDECIFLATQNGVMLIVVIHVDDYLVASSEDNVDHFHNEICARIEIYDRGKLGPQGNESLPRKGAPYKCSACVTGIDRRCSYFDLIHEINNFTGDGEGRGTVEFSAFSRAYGIAAKLAAGLSLGEAIRSRRSPNFLATTSHQLREFIELQL